MPGPPLSGVVPSTRADYWTLTFTVTTFFAGL